MPDEETQGAAGAGWFVENLLPKLGPIAAVLNEGAVGTIGTFSPDTIVMLVQIAEKQPLWVRVMARGESGHGSAPHDNNAADKLIRGLHRLQNTELRSEITPAVAQMLQQISVLESGLSATAMRNANSWPFSSIIKASMAKKSPQASSSTRNTCSLTELSAGIKTNVIPDQASATLDCRLLPSQDMEAFKTELLAIMNEDDLELEIILQSPSGPESSAETKIFEHIRNAVGQTYPKAIVAPYMSAGYTDNAFFRRKGVTAYGFNPLVLTPEQIKGAHNRDERIGVEAFEKALQIYTDLLQNLAATP